MSWWEWGFIIFIMLSLGSMLLGKTTGKPKGKKKASAREMSASRSVHISNSPYSGKVPMHEGLPHPGEAIRQAKSLSSQGCGDEALALLVACRNKCAEVGLVKSVQTLSNEIMTLHHQEQADAIQEQILGVLARHPDGILQTALCKGFSDVDPDITRLACYQLAEAGSIIRERKGRSYLLRLVDPNRLE